MKKLALALLLMLFTQTAYAADLVVEDAWVRLVPPVAENTAAYMLLRNTGADDVKLTGITCSLAASAGLHGMRMDGNRMAMFPLQEVIVPAGAEVSFAPGGKHIMLMGLKRPLKAGDALEMVLQTSAGETLKILATVRDMRMGHHHQGGMH
ncbi:MAG TPA: copper chaperone PCu(A)C [Mariprofundaceae bacterium]|nr:copper chaperone PCu(A)C [Mariprofundaceae bacterium]